MLEIFLILLVCPIAAGGATLMLAKKEGASFGKAFSVALLSAVVFTVAALWAANECELAAYLRQELQQRLTPQELRTLRADGFVCATSYTFDRRGKRAQAGVYDGLRGARVYIADDRGP